MSFATLRGEPLIFIKLASIPDPFSTTLSEVETHGVWIKGGEIATILQQISLKRRAPLGAEPHKRFPRFFVPYSNIEWIAMAE